MPPANICMREIQAIASNLVTLTECRRHISRHKVNEFKWLNKEVARVLGGHLGKQNVPCWVIRLRDKKVCESPIAIIQDTPHYFALSPVGNGQQKENDMT